MSKFISREKLKALIDSGAQHKLVEALPKKYFDSEHLPNAINIPHDEIESSAAVHLHDKSEPVIVYCANIDCQNSHIAAESLRKLGYTNVCEYHEGKKDWTEAGLPMIVGGDN
jgi:rhodanese-related sulfurtransferase